MALDRIRSFIAIPLPAGLRESIRSLVGRLRARPGGDRVRWVRPENLHVTLRFLGDIERELVPALIAEVGERVAREPAFELSLPGARVFANRRRPGLVVLTLAPTEPLSALAAAVEEGVVATGLPPEERPFWAHLTLGRMRERRSELVVTASDTALSDALPVTEVVLYQSELQSSGAIHTPLGQLPLGQTALGPPSAGFTPTRSSDR